MKILCSINVMYNSNVFFFMSNPAHDAYNYEMYNLKCYNVYNLTEERIGHCKEQRHGV